MESIYNLIPVPKPAVVKPKRYQSKYNPKQPPTGSTFGMGNTSKLAGANLGVEAAAGEPRRARRNLRERTHLASQRSTQRAH